MVLPGHLFLDSALLPGPRAELELQASHFSPTRTSCIHWPPRCGLVCDAVDYTDILLILNFKLSRVQVIWWYSNAQMQMSVLRERPFIFPPHIPHETHKLVLLTFSGCPASSAHQMWGAPLISAAGHTSFSPPCCGFHCPDLITGCNGNKAMWFHYGDRKSVV